ncbi:MAG: ferric reductase-like transmembrane domain-containing protein [Candidatus Buchananbacteria bacterium]|nr:ferric reductase-like transmembrane domain-containing protein [Candidatus Buchananbacteria bacterium]
MTKIKHNYVWLAIVILSLVPALLWLLSPSLLPRLGSLRAVMSDLGQLAGLIGMALFSFSLILSARFRFLDKYFKGLNNVYAKHSLIGQVAFVLLLFHPLLLLFKYAGGSFSGAMLFLSLSSNWPKNWGWLALVLMISLIVLTLYLKPKYNIWKWTHKFLGLSFFFASLHVFLIPSDVSRYAPLRFYMLSLSFLALAVFAYRTLFGKYLIKKYKYTVSAVKSLNDNVLEVIMKPQGRKLDFNPGQFIFVSFLDSKVGQESHPFSISSGPSDGELKITAKVLGDYTEKLANLSPGTTAEVEGPFGFFSHKNSIYNNQIWIAGGIGITPFLSMAKSLLDNSDYSIDLFYCLKNESESVYLDWLKNINPKLRVHLFCYDKSGYINIDIINNIAGSLSEKDIFICAPPVMIGSLKKQFIGRGIDKKLIHSEEFNF